MSADRCPIHRTPHKVCKCVPNKHLGGDFKEHAAEFMEEFADEHERVLQAWGDDRAALNIALLALEKMKTRYKAGVRAIDYAVMCNELACHALEEIESGAKD